MSATERATALKSAQATKKQKVTTSAKKVHDSIDKRKDFSIVTALFKMNLKPTGLTLMLHILSMLTMSQVMKH